jgi:hypothetical protein
LVGASVLESMSNLLKSDLVGSHALSNNLFRGQLSSVSILSVKTVDFHDYAKVDESSFEIVNDYLERTQHVDTASSHTHFIVSVGASAAVAAMLAVYFFVKRMKTAANSVVNEGDGANMATTDMDHLESFSKESTSAPHADNFEIITTSPVKLSNRVVLSSLPRLQVDPEQIKQLVIDEENIFKNIRKLHN